MQVKQIETGSIQENCYIVYKKNEALIIDPGNNKEKILSEIEVLDVMPKAILLTHTHYDHIGALEVLRQSYNVPVYVGKQEKNWLSNPQLNLSSYSDHEIIAKPAEFIFEVPSTIKIGLFSFKVVHTPGHSPGSVSFIFEEGECVFSGDALFKGSIGRTDLPGSEPEKLIPAVEENILSLPDHYIVYPGHLASTTILHEKQSNPFFKNGKVR
ncbi:MBL fold metallo-hydrolase [Alkalibacterium kapii]|uniref:MBL fold metallo-hydrolase n=1 Tax=Alkalibacterium kapii TaxID=426704 RepID=UPI001C98E9BB|nr:MBL fold metallo-hydrolase [Alkalibacterium kapii]